MIVKLVCIQTVIFSFSSTGRRRNVAMICSAASIENNDFSFFQHLISFSVSHEYLRMARVREDSQFLGRASRILLLWVFLPPLSCTHPLLVRAAIPSWHGVFIATAFCDKEKDSSPSNQRINTTILISQQSLDYL